ncbi:hypothetical protein EPUS_02723 [Endocarpon pusillum Z07020]|uniref:NACHT-NTPase and P-loop NTPases N-terminal domain-containing protein n=1 Tax=Endocarpon pusillum (strain Z07020 / HMAS-L-300199) TaxID=1263415 RepID=U1FU20_ENDPU|nr:uncharacterized protein EPUS_02723 [Endocarpon pusillum Z07020]ERF68267.1 hypothetical protein EPUS_02723 [Endocarpon pusillum Z07020]
MEALELVAIITTFVELGVKVLKRLKEFHDDAKVPGPFRSVRNGLPLTISTLKRTQAQAEAGHLSLGTTKTLAPSVGGCLSQVRYLEDKLGRKQASVVTLLLDNGARINAMDNKQTIPLCAATLLGNGDIVKLMLYRLARINPPKNVGRSALHEAARRGQHMTVQRLLDRGAKVNVVDDHGWTPLHNAYLASKHSHSKVTKLLLEHKKAKVHTLCPKPKDGAERLDKSPVRILYMEPKQKD